MATPALSHPPPLIPGILTTCTCFCKTCCRFWTQQQGSTAGVIQGDGTAGGTRRCTRRREGGITQRTGSPLHAATLMSGAGNLGHMMAWCREAAAAAAAAAAAGRFVGGTGAATSVTHQGVAQRPECHTQQHQLQRQSQPCRRLSLRPRWVKVRQLRRGSSSLSSPHGLGTGEQLRRCPVSMGRGWKGGWQGPLCHLPGCQFPV